LVAWKETDTYLTEQIALFKQRFHDLKGPPSGIEIREPPKSPTEDITPFKLGDIILFSDVATAITRT
jgi:hypothetical protein